MNGKAETFQLVSKDGAVYEASCGQQPWDSQDKDWIISYPEGDIRFIGSTQQAKPLVKKLIKERKSNPDL